MHQLLISAETPHSILFTALNILFSAFLFHIAKVLTLLLLKVLTSKTIHYYICPVVKLSVYMSMAVPKRTYMYVP